MNSMHPANWFQPTAEVNRDVEPGANCPSKAVVAPNMANWGESHLDNVDGSDPTWAAAEHEIDVPFA
jgi:hypothetical protein